jgi:hypothetical protein
MPRIQRDNLPRPLLEHLYEQAAARNLSVDDLIELRHWLDDSPEVPSGSWFKRFPTFILCGDGALPKTFLLAGRLPWGKEVM